MRPIHCPDRFDSREWLGFGAPGERVTCGPDLHYRSQSGLAAVLTWIREVVGVVRAHLHPGRILLPHPDARQPSIDCQWVDLSTAHLIIGVAHRLGVDADVFYIGIAAQEGSGQWRGLAGFYLPWCNACEPAGQRSFDTLREAFSAAGVPTPVVAIDLPVDLAATSGWFDPDRLLAGGPISSSPWAHQWTSAATITDPTQSALVRVGPTTVGFVHTVLVEHMDVGLEMLHALGIAKTADDTTMVRTGPYTPMHAYFAVQDSWHTGVIRRTRQPLPSAWGCWRTPSGVHVSRSTGHALRAAHAAGGLTFPLAVATPESAAPISLTGLLHARRRMEAKHDPT